MVRCPPDAAGAGKSTPWRVTSTNRRLQAASRLPLMLALRASMMRCVSDEPGPPVRPTDSSKEDEMRSRIFVGAFLLVGVLAAGAVATSGDRTGPTRQWAIASLSEPTLIGSTIVQGPVLFTHDNANMARGQPCPSVQPFDPAQGP